MPLGTETVPDVEAAVHLGLAQRPQLLLLRGMIANLNKDTLDAARQFLSTISPLLGHGQLPTPLQGDDQGGEGVPHPAGPKRSRSSPSAPS